MSEYRSKHIIPYKLFEIASHIKPDKFDVDRVKYGNLIVSVIEFEYDNQMYTCTLTILNHLNLCNYYYITFTTKDIYDFIMNRYKSGEVSTVEYNALDTKFSALTNLNKPFGVLARIIWLVDYVNNKYSDNISHVAYASDVEEKLSIYGYYMNKNNYEFVCNIKNNIAPNKNILLYRHV